jgi:hypothetical protein
MAGSLKPGARLRSVAAGTEVVVVRPAGQPVIIACAGDELVPLDGAAAGLGDAAADGPVIALGKRYRDEQTGLELLCTKAGRGPLTADGRELGIKAPRPLPSSD